MKIESLSDSDLRLARLSVGDDYGDIEIMSKEGLTPAEQKYEAWKADQPTKCPDCEALYQLIRAGEASMMPNKCFPKGGQPCRYLILSNSTGQAEKV